MTLRLGAANLQWLRFSSEDRSDDDVRAEGGRLVAGGAGLILTVEASTTRPLSHGRLVGILAIAADLSGEAGAHSPIVVVLAGFDRRSVDAAVDEVRHGRYLLIDQPGRGRWCGRSTAYCDPDTVTAALGILRDQVSERLHLELRQDRPGVYNGLYRGPTLQLTDKWVDVDTVLREVVGTTTAAFLIADQMRARVSRVTWETQILRVATVSMEFVDAVARCAGAKANADVIIDEFDSSSEELERLRRGTDIILCTDLILTQNNAKRALAEVLNWHAVPILVLTAFDARQDRGDIALLGTSVPVVSLVQIEVFTSMSHGATPVDIDPVLRSAVVARHQLDRRYPWDPDEFLTACSAVERSLSLGHTGRAAHRHFTVNFDVGRLIAEDSPLRAQIVARLVGEVTTWVPATDTLVICHPDHAEEYAGRLARLVSVELRRRLPGLTVSTLPVRRAVLGSRWVFPAGLDLALPGVDVVLLDWGSIEAVTITQLMRLTAEAGAGRILGLVLLSQLQQQDERALTMIQSVEGTRPPVNGVTTSVPVRVQFVTAVGLSAMPLNKCPLCQLARQLDADIRRGLPKLIERYLLRLADALRVRSRTDVANSPFDAFGARTEDVAGYIRLRIRLLAAMRDTATRQLVAMEFTELAEHGDLVARHAAINILAAERQWLKLPPLRFANCREAVARLALNVALEKGTNRRLRLQAVIVLVAAAPETLVRNLPVLWNSFSGNLLLTFHLLYQLHRIVERRRGDTPVEMDELRGQIAACQDMVKDAPARPSGLREELDWQLTKLNLYVNTRLVGESEGDSRNAWRALRDQYLRRLADHIDAESAILQLRLRVDNIPYQNGLDTAGLVGIRRNWITVVTFLADFLVPFLPSLAAPLGGAFAEEHFDSLERDCLRQLSSPDWMRYVSKLETQFWTLRESQGGAAQNEMRDKLDESLQILHRTILEAGGTELEMARLAHFLESCPSKLDQALLDCVRESERVGDPIAITFVPCAVPDVEVFCPEELLSNTVKQLVGNVVAKKHRAPGWETCVVELEISVTVEDKLVRVFFRNTGTVATKTPGRGIETARRKLQDFGGGLTVLEPDGRWSFEVELRVRRWSDQIGRSSSDD